MSQSLSSLPGISRLNGTRSSPSIRSSSASTTSLPEMPRNLGDSTGEYWLTTCNPGLADSRILEYEFAGNIKDFARGDPKNKSRHGCARTPQGNFYSFSAGAAN